MTLVEKLEYLLEKVCNIDIPEEAEEELVAILDKFEEELDQL